MCAGKSNVGDMFEMLVTDMAALHPSSLNFKNVTNINFFNSCIPWFVLFHFEFHNDHPENGNMVLYCSLLLNKVHSYHSLLLLNRINFKFDHVGNRHVMDRFFTTRFNIFTFQI